MMKQENAFFITNADGPAGTRRKYFPVASFDHYRHTKVLLSVRARFFLTPGSTSV
jgi:hypothetical protein